MNLNLFIDLCISNINHDSITKLIRDRFKISQTLI